MYEWFLVQYALIFYVSLVIFHFLLATLNHMVSDTQADRQFPLVEVLPVPIPAFGLNLIIICERLVSTTSYKDIIIP